MRLIALIIPILLLSFGTQAGPEQGIHWTAYCRTAKGITGDITVSPSAIWFEDGHRLHLIYVGESRGVTLEPGDPLTKLFRIEAPKPIRFDAGYELCGKKLRPTFLSVIDREVSNYELMMMGNARDDKMRMLILTIFTGRALPDAHTDKDRICASFGYIRAAKDVHVLTSP